jgi:Flp pilus assembly protein TadG
MRLTVASTPQDTAERIKSEFTTEIKQKKKGTYLLTRTWYQAVQIKISPGPNNGTNVSVGTGYTTAMESALVIAALVLLLTPIYLIISVPLLIGLIAAPIFISKPLAEEVSAKLTQQTMP